MPITHEVRPDGTLVITARGALTPAALEPLRDVFQADPRLASVRSTLVDCREVTSWDVSADTLREYAETREEDQHLARSDSRLAIVATSNVGFGLARLYAQSGAVYGKIEVFRTMEEAETWLAEKR